MTSVALTAAMTQWQAIRVGLARRASGGGWVGGSVGGWESGRKGEGDRRDWEGNTGDSFGYFLETELTDGLHELFAMRRFMAADGQTVGAHCDDAGAATWECGALQQSVLLAHDAAPRVARHAAQARHATPSIM